MSELDLANWCCFTGNRHFVSPTKDTGELLSRGKGKENCVRVHYCLAVSGDGKHLFGLLSYMTSTNLFKKRPPDLRDESDVWLKTAEECVNIINSSEVAP